MKSNEDHLFSSKAKESQQVANGKGKVDAEI